MWNGVEENPGEINPGGLGAVAKGVGPAAGGGRGGFNPSVWKKELIPLYSPELAASSGF